MATAEEVLARLRDDFPFYAEHCLRIVNKRGKVVPFSPLRPAQLKLWEALREQRDAGRPMRAAVLKSRQTGISTAVQGMILQRTSMDPNHRALVVGHKNTSAGALFRMGSKMWEHLPAELKPERRHFNDAEGRRYMEFGVRSREARDRGESGLNSWIRAETAAETEGGRADTIRSCHFSEVAFWPDPAKSDAVMNAVPEAPGTLVVYESTAKGLNFWKDFWDRAEAGRNDFAPVFIGWPEDPDCWRDFASEEDREAFIEDIGCGPFGVQEQWLVDEFGCAPEQLYWRRHTIENRCRGKLEVFQQEYPATPEEAFIGSGRHVFSMVHMSRVRTETARWAETPAEEGGPQEGVFKPVEFKHRQVQGGTVDVPTKVLWVPRAEAGLPDHHPWWTRWEIPDRSAEWWREQHETGDVSVELMERGIERAMARDQFPPQYVVAVDPAGDIDTDDGLGTWEEDPEHAFTGIEVIDHRTGEQVAEWQARTEHDQVAYQALLAGLYFGDAWLGVEITGGYGIAIATTLLWRRFGYRRLYERPRLDVRQQDSMKDRLGWSTDRRTKPQMEAMFAELLREGTHGVKSPRLARELTTYVKDDRGRHGPEEGKHSDLLMAYMQAQEIRRLKPLRKKPSEGPRPTSLTRRLPWG